MSNDQRNLTFKDLLDYVSKAIPNYRRLIFKSLVTFMVIGKDRKCIASVVRCCASFFFHSKITEKRFYLFLASAMIKWDLILSNILQLLGEDC